MCRSTAVWGSQSPNNCQATPTKVLSISCSPNNPPSTPAKTPSLALLIPTTSRTITLIPIRPISPNNHEGLVRVCSRMNRKRKKSGTNLSWSSKSPNCRKSARLSPQPTKNSSTKSKNSSKRTTTSRPELWFWSTKLRKKQRKKHKTPVPNSKTTTSLWSH